MNKIILSILFLFLFSCDTEDIIPSTEYLFIDPQLQPYLDQYILECERFQTDYKFPISFTMILSDSIGSDNGMGAGVTLRYKNQPDKVRLLITNEMDKWSESSRRYVIFHELGHALRQLNHQNNIIGIMNTNLYPALERYSSSKFVQDYMEEKHFIEGL